MKIKKIHFSLVKKKINCKKSCGNNIPKNEAGET